MSPRNILTRQQAIFYSLVEQFQEASGAMDEMADSAGTLQDSYDIYMDSVTAHVNQFKAAFQSLSSTTMDAGFMKDIVDAGTDLLGILREIVQVIDSLGGLSFVTFGAGLITLFTQIHKSAGRPKRTGLILIFAQSGEYEYLTVPAYAPVVTRSELAT